MADQHVREVNAAVSQEIRRTFETVAKLALQGSAEADDPSLNVFEKMRKAHSRVTLIIDDAMRGLAELNELMVVQGVFAGVRSAENDDDE